MVDDDGMMRPSISFPTDSASNSGSGCSSVSNAESIDGASTTGGESMFPAKLDDKSDFRGWSSSANERLVKESGLAIAYTAGRQNC